MPIRRRYWAVACVCFLGLLVSFIPLLPYPRPVASQSPAADVAEPLELKYDDGSAVGTIKGKGCAACRTFQGVRFTLPEGLPSAELTGLKFCVSGKGNFTIYITKDGNLIHDPFKFTAVALWNTYTLPEEVVVPHDFWIILAIYDESSMPYYDAGIDSSIGTRSWHGDGIGEGKLSQPLPGDLMIRALLRAEVHVGPGRTFARIQDAIDAVGNGTTIAVHESTYHENVTVYKSVRIRALSGPQNTIVETPVVDRNTFTITAPDVTLCGFTIQGATDLGSAGVCLDGIRGCLVCGNTILDNDRGIYVASGATGNILLQNECKYNTEGICVDGSGNYISGNNVHGNTAVIGSGVFVSEKASGNTLRFNTIQVDQGIDPSVASSPQVCTTSSAQQVDAVNNWWGSDTGPANAANPGGVGSPVTDMVLFDPWLKTPPVFVDTVAANNTDYTLDVTEEASASLVKEGSGTPVISLASFAKDPFDQFTGKPLGRWIDVLFSSTTDVKQVEIRIHYTADEVASLNPGSLRLYWWNTEKEGWTACSLTGVDKKDGFVWAKVNVSSKPGLNDLNGTFFTAGTAKGGGGFAWWTIPLVIVLVLLLLVAFRLFWVLVVKQERM